MSNIPRCAICGSNEHGYKRHYPVPSKKLYDKLKEKWEHFIGDIQFTDSETEPIEIYDEAVDDFCKKHHYTEGLKEMAFHDYWYDTFADMLYQKLPDTYDDSKLKTCGKCGFRTDSDLIMKRHSCVPKKKVEQK